MRQNCFYAPYWEYHTFKSVIVSETSCLFQVDYDVSVCKIFRLELIQVWKLACWGYGRFYTACLLAGSLRKL